MAETLLLIRDARHLDDGRAIDLLVDDGRIARIGPGLAAPPGARVLAAGQRVLIPGLIDSHMHLDKTLMGESWVPLPAAHDLAGRIAAQDVVLGDPARRPTAERAAALVRSVLSLGTTSLRSHVDVTPDLGLSSVEAILRVRQEFAGLVDMQLVAFPQKGILRAPGTAELLDEALGMGLEVLGGLDPGGIDGDVEGQLRFLFDRAVRRGVELDIHLHDQGTLGGYELSRIAALTAAEGLQRRVTVSHAYALGDLPADDRKRILDELAEAGVTLVTNGSGVRPIPPIEEVWAAGVRFAFGCDGIRDPWWPYGRGDMLERAFLVVYRNGLRTDPELSRALASATTVGAELLGLGSYGVQVGARADLVLVDAECGPESVAVHPPRLGVIKGGRVLSWDARA